MVTFQYRTPLLCVGVFAVHYMEPKIRWDRPRRRGVGFLKRHERDNDRWGGELRAVQQHQ